MKVVASGWNMYRAGTRTGRVQVSDGYTYRAPRVTHRHASVKLDLSSWKKTVITAFSFPSLSPPPLIRSLPSSLRPSLPPSFPPSVSSFLLSMCPIISCKSCRWENDLHYTLGSRENVSTILEDLAGGRRRLLVLIVLARHVYGRSFSLVCLIPDAITYKHECISLDHNMIYYKFAVPAQKIFSIMEF